MINAGILYWYIILILNIAIESNIDSLTESVSVNESVSLTDSSPVSICRLGKLLNVKQ